jgi:Pyridoxamine 5'-phosphate oxidase
MCPRPEAIEKAIYCGTAVSGFWRQGLHRLDHRVTYGEERRFAMERERGVPTVEAERAKDTALEGFSCREILDENRQVIQLLDLHLTGSPSRQALVRLLVGWLLSYNAGAACRTCGHSPLRLGPSTPRSDRDSAGNVKGCRRWECEEVSPRLFWEAGCRLFYSPQTLFDGSRGGDMATKAQHGVPAEAALAFIVEHPHLYLLTRRADGYPTGYAMMSRVTQGTVSFSTYRSSVKVKNLLREGVGGILAVSKDQGDDRVLVAEGTVSVHDGSEWFDDQAPTPLGLRSDFQPSVPREITEKVSSRHESGKRCVLRLTLTSARLSTRLR